MVRIDVVYEGELHTACSHAPSGASLATDAPRDNHGRGESFSPTDLLATALGSCMLTVMGIHARREGWALEGARVRVEKHMTTELPRRVGRLVAHFEMPEGIAVEAQKALEQTALTCPVKESIHPAIATEFDFRWGSGPAER